MTIIDFQVTLDGSSDPLTAVAALAGVDRIQSIHLEGASTNTHDFTVLGPNGNPLKTVAKYVAGASRVDAFKLKSEGDQLHLSSFKVQGTNTEVVNGFVTIQ